MSVAGNKTRVTIVVDANGKAAIETFEKVENKLDKTQKDVESRNETFSDNIKKNWLGVSAAIVSAYVTATKAWDMAEQAAKFQQSYEAYDTIVRKMGSSAAREFARLQRASAGLIDKQNLVEAANTAHSLGINIQQLNNLLPIARARARDMGITTVQALNDIAVGIGRGSPMILDNLGLTIKLGEANEKYAASIGKAVDQLSAEEKKQALINAVFDAGKESLERHNLETLTAAEQMQKLNAEMRELALSIGEYLLPEVLGLTQALNDFFDELSDENRTNRAFLAIEEEIARTQDMIKNLEEGTGLHAIIQGFWSGKEENIAQAERLKVRQEKLMIDRQRMLEGYSLKEIATLRHLEKELFEVDIEREKDAAKHDARVSNRHFDEAAWMERYIKKLQEISDERERILKRHSKSDVPGNVEGGESPEDVEKRRKLIAEVNRIWDAAEISQAEERRKLIEEVERNWDAAVLARTEQQRQAEEDINARWDAAVLRREWEEKQKRRDQEKEWARRRAERTKMGHQKDLAQIDDFYRAELKALIEAKANEKTVWEEFDRWREERRAALDRLHFGDATGQLMSMINSVEGQELQKGLGMAAGNLSGLQQAADGQDPYSQELERLDSYYQDRLALMAKAGASEQQLKDEFARWEREREDTLQRKKLLMASNTFGMMAGMLYSYYELSGRKSKEAFEAYKLFAAGQAAIDTYRTAQAGASALAGIPFVGPALAMAWIALAIATGFMRVKQIMAQKPGAGMAGAPSGGGGFSYSNPTAPKWESSQDQEKKQQPTIVNNYHVYGNVFDLDETARTLSPAIDKAKADGVGV